MYKVFLSVFFLSIFILACDKDKHDILPPGTEETTTEVAKMMFFTTRSGQYTTTVTCMNADKTIKWKVDLDGFPDGGELAYENGILCISTGYFAWNTDRTLTT